MSRAQATEWLTRVRQSVEADLDRRLAFPGLSAVDDPARTLREAIRYAALGPGKRLRPALAMAACRAVGGSLDAALPVASAVELLHAYTLVHDDLPAMDDDDERRGRPTVHVEFGEGTAVLAGDALLTLAFAALADLGTHAADAVEVLARRGGATELLAGQARDLAAANRSDIDFETLEQIHRGKTGALFAASAELGAIAGGATRDLRSALAEFGMAVGIAFQFGDDKLDGEFAAHRAKARERTTALASHARELLADLPGDTSSLESLVQWIAIRE